MADFYGGNPALRQDWPVQLPWPRQYGPYLDLGYQGFQPGAMLDTSQVEDRRSFQPGFMDAAWRDTMEPTAHRHFPRYSGGGEWPPEPESWNQTDQMWPSEELPNGKPTVDSILPEILSILSGRDEPKQQKKEDKKQEPMKAAEDLIELLLRLGIIQQQQQPRQEDGAPMQQRQESYAPMQEAQDTYYPPMQEAQSYAAPQQQSYGYTAVQAPPPPPPMLPPERLPGNTSGAY